MECEVRALSEVNMRNEFAKCIRGGHEFAYARQEAGFMVARSLTEFLFLFPLDLILVTPIYMNNH